MEDLKLPHKRSAYKEIRKSKKRHLRNVSLKSDLKTSIKRFEKLIVEKKIDEAKGYLKTLIQAIDKAVSKGMLHKNNASRKISRLTKKIASLPKA
jgi:small subunit ribosomal protein S20